MEASCWFGCQVSSNNKLNKIAKQVADSLILGCQVSSNNKLNKIAKQVADSLILGCQVSSNNVFSTFQIIQQWYAYITVVQCCTTVMYATIRGCGFSILTSVGSFLVNDM